MADDAEVLGLIHVEAIEVRGADEEGFSKLMREQADPDALRQVAVRSACRALGVTTDLEMQARLGEVTRLSAMFVEGFICGSIFRRQMIPIDWRRSDDEAEQAYLSIERLMKPFQQWKERKESGEVPEP